MSGDTWISLLLVLASLMLSAFFSAGETSLESRVSALTDLLAAWRHRPHHEPPAEFSARRRSRLLASATAAEKVAAAIWQVRRGHHQINRFVAPSRISRSVAAQWQSADVAVRRRIYETARRAVAEALKVQIKR